MINFTQFLEEGILSQQKYAEKAGVKGPLDDLSNSERYAKVLEHLGHTIEEVVEARMLVPRRSWKTSEPGYLDDESLKREFCFEITDVLLFLRAVVAYSGISVEEFETHFNKKLKYNLTRPDHK
jgi:hypothetical protein